MIVGIDEKSKVVMVVGRVPMAIEGYKVIRLTQVPRILAVDRRKKYRPLVSGISIGHCQITCGTLAGLVEYQNELMLVSNAHVFHPQPWEEEPPDRAEILQPGPWPDGGDLKDAVGLFEKHVPVKLEEESACPLAKLFCGVYNRLAEVFRAKTRLKALTKAENEVDVAVARPINKSVLPGQEVMDVLLDNGTLVKPRNIIGLLFAGSEPDNIYIACKARNIEKHLRCKFTTEIHEPEIDEEVIKCGRTTGCSTGPVQATSMTVRVFYGKGFATFRDCIVVNAKSAGGDSGSLVWKPV